MDEKKSKIVAGQHAWESKYKIQQKPTKLLQKNLGKRKYFLEKEIFLKVKSSFLLFSSGFCEHTIASVTHKRESKNLSLQ